MDDELTEIIRRITDAGRGYGILAFPAPMTNKTFKLKGECSVTGAIDKNIDTLTIPKDLGGCPVTRIGRSAFERCIWLETVEIPDDIKSIGRYAFKGCKGLKSVKVGKGATSIFDGAFENCAALESVTIDDGTKMIFKNAFRGCTALKEVVVPDDAIIEDGAFPEGCKIIRRSAAAAQQSEAAAAEVIAPRQTETVFEAKAQAEQPAAEAATAEASDDVAAEPVAESAQEEIKNAPKELTFAEQVDAVLSGKRVYGDIKVCDTPQILLDVGCEQLPMFYTQNHLKNAIKPKNRKQHFHGLSIEQVKLFPEKIKEPIFVFDSLTQNDSLLMVFNDFDTEKCPIVATIKPNGKGKYNFDIVDSNFITSFYGREDFSDFIEENINKNKVLYYNKKRSKELFSVLGLEFPSGFNNLASDTIIRQSSAFVNSNEQKNSDNISETITEEATAAKMSTEEKIKALDVQTLAEEYRKNYADIYDNEENYTPEQRERYSQAVTKFDAMRKNPDISDVINNVQNAMGDWITSDREAAAFTFAVENLLAAETKEVNEMENKPNTTDYKTEVINSVEQEFNAFRQKVMQQSSEEIFNRNYEITIKTELKDFLTANDELEERYYKALSQEKGHIINLLYDDFIKNGEASIANSDDALGFIEDYCEYHYSDIVNEQDEQEEITEEVKAMSREQELLNQYGKNMNPVYHDYLTLAVEHPDVIVAQRLGDFYEVFDDNAKKISEILDLTLTGRDCGLPERVPMVGFPYFAAEDYVNQLAEQGVKMVLSDKLAENAADVAENAETVRNDEVMLEDAKQNARAIATAEGKPFVVINYSEHSAFRTGDIMSLVAAENRFTYLNDEAKKSKAEGGFEGYYKTGYDIYYLDPKNNGIAGYTGGRFDIGDETSGLIQHIREVAQSSSSMLTESQRASCMEFVNYLEGVVRGEKEPEHEAAAPAKKSRKKRTTKSTEEKIIDPAEAADFNPREKSNSAAENIRDEMVKALLESMQKNPEKWEKGWIAASNAPENGSTGKTYRGVNNLYLSLVAEEKGYKDNRWVTFDQARKMKASVKKGEKSAPILYYSQYDKITKKEFTEATVKGMTAEEREEYIQKNVHSVLKYSRVFNAEQCLNFPEKAPLPEMDEQERARQNAKIENIIKNSAAPVNYDGGNRAYYSPYEDAVHLPEIKSFKTMQDYYATALHEIAHSTGHESRLNRDLKSGEFGDKNYAQEELRAELASVFLQAQTGITLEGSHIDNHGAYLSSWLKSAEEDGGYKKFYAAVSDAQKISDYIIANYLKESEIADITPQETAAEDKPADETPENVATEKPEEIKAAAPVQEAKEKSTEEKIITDAPLTAREQKMKNALETFVASDLEESGKITETTLEAIRLQGFEYVDGKIIKSRPKETPQNAATARELPSERENAPVSDGNPTEPVKTASAWKRVEIKEDQIGKEYGESVMLRMPADGEYNKYVAFVPKKLISKSEKTGKTYLSINHGYNYTLNNDGIKVKLDGEQFAAAIKGEEVNVAGERVAPNRINARRIENIDKNAPEDMKSSPNWGVYYVKWNDEKKKYDKITVSAITGERIKANDPATWATFTDAKDYAMKNNCAGLSYVLDGSMSCIDLDHQLGNDNKMSETAEKLCGELKGTYIERSVSGDGLHIFLRGDYNEDGKYYYKKKLENGDEVEMYSTGKIISMTGDIYADAKAEVNICPTATTAWLHKQLERPIPAATNAAATSATSAKPQARSYQKNSRRTAAEVEEFILKTKNAQEYTDLRAGKLIKGDHSADDFKFLTIVGYYSDNDRSIMQELFTTSALYRPEKGEDYVNRSIDKAIAAKTRTIGDYLADKRSEKSANEAKRGAHS